LRALDTQDYDIIIADYKLPGIDGLTFFNQIQKRRPAPLKILITAYGTEELISRANGMGVHDFVPKPFTSNDIENSLRNLLQSDQNK
jgi:DNA-binding NtrC family response regulator